MNGLVGYGSSDEEEDDVVPTGIARTASTHVLENGSVAVNGTSTSEQSLGEPDIIPKFSEPRQGPMVGPSKPTEVTSADYEDGDLEDSMPMPERDMLRYLTQPSHPMTSLPPEPTEDADPTVTAKFRRFLELKSKGIHFNEDLASKTSFKNPNLFASLLERADLPSQAQYSSTFSSNLFDLKQFPEWAYKENLLKSQQEINAELEATKKSQSAAGKRTIEFAPASRGSAGSRESTPGGLAKRKRT